MMMENVFVKTALLELMASAFNADRMKNMMVRNVFVKKVLT